MILNVDKSRADEAITSIKLQEPFGGREIADGLDNVAGNADICREWLVSHPVKHHAIFYNNIVRHKKAITMPMAAITEAMTQNRMVTLASGQPEASK